VRFVQQINEDKANPLAMATLARGRKLTASDNVQNFKSGNRTFLLLKTFLQKQAKHFQESNIAQTYVVANE
jgi:hypothetical protein